MFVALSFDLKSDLTTDRGHNQIMNAALREAMTRHHRLYSSRHFELNADTRPGGAYGYTARTAAHQRRKARIYHHQKPLVFKGRLRHHFLNLSRITATKDRARIQGRFPYPLDKHRREQQIREVQSISDRELGDFGAFVALRYAQMANDPKFRRRRSRKVKTS